VEVLFFVFSFIIFPGIFTVEEEGGEEERQPWSLKK
jgi:hypothetical protein